MADSSEKDGLGLEDLTTLECEPQESVSEGADDGTLAPKRFCDGHVRLSKSEKKVKKFQAIVARKKASRKAKREQRKQRLKEQNANPLPNSSEQGHYDEDSVLDTHHNGPVIDHAETADTYVCKKERLKCIKDKMEESLRARQRVCIDLTMESQMSTKQTSRLVQQLGRLYGSNRRASKPLCTYFTGLKKEGFLYQECVRKNAGFLSYYVHMTDKSHLDVFKAEEIIYLSPDSKNILEDVSEDKVYIIGGLVDETTHKNCTQDTAEKSAIQTARLPIEEHMVRKGTGNFSKVLTVNQVYDILLTYTQTKDWRSALKDHVPKRTGYVLKDQE